MADNEKLQLGLSLQVDLDAFEVEWKNKQKAIQDIIDGHTFDVKIGGIQGLAEVQKEMERFARGVRASSKVDLVNTDSIKGLKDEIRALEIEWANLSKQQKFVDESTRELTPHAIELATRYAELRAELERYGMSLKEAEKAGKSFAANRARIAAEDITQPDFELLQMAEYYKIIERESAKAYEARMREQEAEAKIGESLAQAVILQNQMTQARNADYAALVKQLAAEEKLAETLHNESLRREAYQSMGQRDFSTEQMKAYYEQLEESTRLAKEVSDAEARRGEERFRESQRIQAEKAKEIALRNEDYENLKRQIVEEAKLASDAEAKRGEARFRESQRVQQERQREIALQQEEYDNLIRQIQEEAKAASAASAQRGAARFRESQRIQAEKARELQLQQEEYEALRRQLREEAKLASMQKNRRDNERYTSQQKRISEGLRIQQILSTEAKTLDAINQRLAIQRQRLGEAAIGSAKYKKIEKDIAALEAQLRSLNGTQQRSVSTTNAQTAAFQRQSGVLNGLKQFMNSYISLLGGYRLMSNIKQITSEFELQRVSLRAITQDAAFADALFAKIKATATESPFSTKDLVTYTKQLAAYRIENEQLYGTMNMLADVSAGLGVSMDRLILAYGQVKAASVLRGTELRQFTEAGIPLVDELAKKFSQLRGEVVSTGEVFDLISTRQVPFEMVADIFKEMTAEGGRFYEMQKKQSESLYGVFENLKDNIQNAFDEIGRSNRGLLMGLGKLATVGAKNLDILIAAISPLVVGMGAYRAATVLATKGTLGLSVSTNLLARAEQSLALAGRQVMIGRAKSVGLLKKAKAANDAYAVSVIRAYRATNVFAKSWHLLSAAVLANPIGAILTLVTAVGSAMKYLFNKLGDTEDALQRTAKFIEGVSDSVEKKFNLKPYDDFIKKIKEQDQLVHSAKMSYQDFAKVYPELAKLYKTQSERIEALNNVEQDRRVILTQIKSEYPEYFSYLNAEKGDVADLAHGYAILTEEMRKAKLQQLKEKKISLEAAVGTLELEREYKGVARFFGWLNKTANEGVLNTTKASLDAINKAIKELEDVIETSVNNTILWRQEYQKINKLLKDGISDEDLSKMDFSESIDKTRQAWASAKEQIDEYSASLFAAETTLKNMVLTPDTDYDESIEAQQSLIDHYNTELKRLQDLVKAAEDYAKFGGFSLITPKKSDTTPLDNLKSELSLVEKIYKRYGELRRLMSDEAAKADIEDIYGNLTDVDFLDPAKLKARLQKMLKAAQDMGDSGKQLAIELGLKIQDIDLNEAKDKLESALSSLSQQIKQQQDASEFFEKMLGLTGDVELSTNLTLGVTGVDVEGGNVGQLLSQQLAEILYSEPVRTQVATEFDLTGDWNADKLEEAIRKGEVSVEMLQNLADKLPQDVQPKFREALASFVDFNKQQVENLFKTIDKYGDSEVKLKLLAQQFESKKLNFSKMINPNPDEISTEDWAEYIRKGIEAAEKAYNEEVGKVRLESFQKQFAEELSNLDAITTEKAQIMIDSLDAILKDVKLDPTQMKTLNDYKEKLRQVFFDKEPTEEAKKAWTELWEAIMDNDSEAAATALNNLSKSLESMIKKAKEVETIMNTLIDSALNIADAFGVAFSDDAQDAINQFKNGIGTVVSGLTAAKSAVDLFSGTDKTMKNLTLTALALSAAFAAISWISGAKVRKANKEIERQEKLLKSLERAYNRLEEVQEELVGTDWVRNQQQQIANLQKQIAAFEAQRRAEQSKGKKTDEDAIEDYTDKILDAQEQMRELRKEIVSEMAGTNLSDAAKDFAQSWLDAYLSFDDTMGALKSSFKDMMKTMVQNSMMAKLVQKRLEPVFAAIDKAYEDAELTPAEWQSIMDMGNKAIEYIDEDLNHLAEMLNLRDQLGTQEVSNLTGIAKGVAQASEETVLTLAGYANSILYYQIWLKNDVAAIRAILEGKVAAVSPAPTGDGGFNVGQLVSLQQQSLSQLQAINLNTGNTVSQLQTLNDKIDSIISTAGTSSRKVVNTRLSN